MSRYVNYAGWSPVAIVEAASLGAARRGEFEIHYGEPTGERWMKFTDSPKKHREAVIAAHCERLEKEVAEFFRSLGL